MKRIAAAALVAGLGIVVGCNTGKPGGPGATGKDGGKASSAQIVTPDNEFTLGVPPLATHLKQGEAKVVEVGIKRGKNFGLDVRLKFDGLPAGVTADPTTPEIKAGQDVAKVTLKVADGAALGDFTVKVIGHPTKGADASNDIRLKVEKK